MQTRGKTKRVGRTTWHNVTHIPHAMRARGGNRARVGVERLSPSDSAIAAPESFAEPHGVVDGDALQFTIDPSVRVTMSNSKSKTMRRAKGSRRVQPDPQSQSKSHVLSSEPERSPALPLISSTTLPRVTVENIRQDMWVVRNPNWDASWGNLEIHPNAGAVGQVKAWSNMEGERLGDSAYKSSNQLQWGGLVVVHWTPSSESDEWKSKQAYRIGFGGEFWLAIHDRAGDERAESGAPSSFVASPARTSKPRRPRSAPQQRPVATAAATPTTENKRESRQQHVKYATGPFSFPMKDHKAPRAKYETKTPEQLYEMATAISGWPKSIRDYFVYDQKGVLQKNAAGAPAFKMRKYIEEQDSPNRLILNPECNLEMWYFMFYCRIASHAQAAVEKAELNVVGGKQTSTIHVKGLGIKEKHLGKEALKAAFSKYGAVNSVRLQSLSGFAFVEFEDADAAAHCMAEGGPKSLGGQPCSVEPWVALWNVGHPDAGTKRTTTVATPQLL